MKTQHGGSVVRYMARQVLNTTDLSDPHEVTEVVLTQLQPEDQELALREGVYLIVRSVVGTMHPSTCTPPPPPPRPRVIGQPRHRTWPVGSIYQVRMRGLTEWKPLGAFTLADVLAAAEQREIRETVNRAAKEDLLNLLEYLRQHDYKSVGEAPEHEVRKIYTP